MPEFVYEVSDQKGHILMRTEYPACRYNAETEIAMLECGFRIHLNGKLLTRGDIKVPPVKHQELTPKQCVFLRGLLRNPGRISESGSRTWILEEVMIDMEDLNPMAVGALVTTLVQKGIITNDKMRTEYSQRKMSIIQLTPLGESNVAGL